MHYKCIIFDFDGTLADTEEQTFNIYNALAEKYKYKKISKRDLHNIKHLNFIEIIKFVDLPYSKIPRMIKEGQKLLKQNMENIKPFQNNIENVINSLNSKVNIMGIITSNTKKNVNSFIVNNKIKVFDFIISSPLLKKEKKINSIARKYKIKKEEILYVGDETRDIISCKKAGVDCAAVTWGYNYPEALNKYDPEYTINKLEDLVDII
ncbi:MAG: HAD-IA family hydrolase [Eubacteriaceae bacterium]